MSLLPSGHSLLRFIPDLDNFLYDPAAYLKEGQVAIGPRKMWGLALLFLAGGAALILSVVYTGHDPSFGERLALGVGLCLGGSIWLGWSLMLRGHELVLQPEGVEVRFRGTSVWCPWALFNVEGEPYIPETDSPMLGLALPVNPEAVPYLELRKNETPMAHGAQVKAPQLVFSGRDTVVLPARYEVKADELGALLLQLGRRLGRNLPKGMPTPEARGLDQLEPETYGLGPDGWFTSHLTKLKFPPHCCRCGQPTNDAMGFVAEAGGLWRVPNLLAGSVRPLTLPVPVCEACQEYLVRRQHQGSGWGMLLGALVGLTVTLAIVMQYTNDLPTLIVAGLGFAAVGGNLGMLIGTAVARQDPVKLRRFSPSRGTVSLRFRNPDYTNEVIDLMQKQARATR